MANYDQMNTREQIRAKKFWQIFIKNFLLSVLKFLWGVVVFYSFLVVLSYYTVFVQHFVKEVIKPYKDNEGAAILFWWIAPFVLLDNN